jgi:hypothetical protein
LTDRKEDWIRIITPEGQEMRASPNYIRKLLGVTVNEADIYNLKHEIRQIKKRVTKLEYPIREKEVIELLSKEEKPHNFTWLKNRVENLTYADYYFMIDEKILLVKKHGKTDMVYLNKGI